MAIRERVDILMGIRDGARHLPAQLGSIAEQTGPHWHLTCSDDGSTDASCDILRGFSADYPGRVRVRRGPQSGFCANYLHMIAALPDDAGFVAFADQDDLWLPHKIARAQRALDRIPANVPALYCARRWIWDGGAGITAGPDGPARQPGFANALVENIAPGNTIMLNAAAARLARDMAPSAGAVFAHDWWLYLLISGAGGVILTDPARVLLYRQHGQNAIGAGAGIAAQLARKGAVLRGAFRARVGGNIAALDQCRHTLTSDNRAALDQFAAARMMPGIRRLEAFRQVRPYRQSRRATLQFWGAAALGKV